MPSQVYQFKRNITHKLGTSHFLEMINKKNIPNFGKIQQTSCFCLCCLPSSINLENYFLNIQKFNFITLNQKLKE